MVDRFVDLLNKLLAINSAGQQSWGQNVR